LKKLALPEEILMAVDKPARYIGQEVNSITKNKEEVDIRFCMCFPDVYEIGMSHLGIQILYDMLNQFSDVWCERTYSPWVDLDSLMREKKIPLFALESQDPIKEFDFLGITIQYEMAYTNILQVLDLSQIPIFSKDRGEEDPIVIGGGPCVYNPEPLAPFFDLFYIGEGETQYRRLLDLYKENKAQGRSKQDFLKKACQIPGIYVPSFYQCEYKEDGTLKAFYPIVEEAPKKIRKEIQMELNETYYPEKPLVPYIKATQDRVMLEIQRGCIRNCRFCQAGQIYKPVRERSVEFLKDKASKMIANTGYEEISLMSLSSSDYTHLNELVSYLIENYHEKGVNVSLPSLRIDAFSLDIMSKVQDIRKSSVTFAAEGGSQKIRDVINKGINEEVILKGCHDAFLGGWNKVKLYFMLGLPMEEDEDCKDIAHLSEKICELYYELIPKENRKGQKASVTASASFFIPKPFTALQWARMYPAEEYSRRAYLVNDEVKKMLNHKSIRFQWHSSDVSVLEGLLARGDRKIAEVIYKAYKKGAIYDAWTEYFHNEYWMEALEECGLSLDFYCYRERETDELFPWDFIDPGVQKSYLIREWNRARKGLVTPNCRQLCTNCGAKIFGGGVCFESKN